MFGVQDRQVQDYDHEMALFVESGVGDQAVTGVGGIIWTETLGPNPHCSTNRLIVRLAVLFDRPPP